MNYFTPHSKCDQTETGVFPIFSINAFRGTCSVDPKLVTEYLLSKEDPESRVNMSPEDVKYQDFELPVHEPDSPILTELMTDMLTQITDKLGRYVQVINGWTIIHHKDNQTYPHEHNGEPMALACVYWAQVPEGSGCLNFYPIGMGYGGFEVRMKPKAGDFCVFSGSLLHGVRQNTSDEKRVSMSLNLGALDFLPFV